MTASLSRSPARFALVAHCLAGLVATAVTASPAVAQDRDTVVQWNRTLLDDHRHAGGSVADGVRDPPVGDDQRGRLRRPRQLRAHLSAVHRVG